MWASIDRNVTEVLASNLIGGQIDFIFGFLDLLGIGWPAERADLRVETCRFAGYLVLLPVCLLTVLAAVPDIEAGGASDASQVSGSATLCTVMLDDVAEGIGWRSG
jgi:hypothetical protein